MSGRNYALEDERRREVAREQRQADADNQIAALRDANIELSRQLDEARDGQVSISQAALETSQALREQLATATAERITLQAEIDELENAPLEPFPDDLNATLRGLMLSIAHCDEEPGEDGLCMCAYEIGRTIREHTDILRAEVARKDEALAAAILCGGCESPLTRCEAAVTSK